MKKNTFEEIKDEGEGRENEHILSEFHRYIFFTDHPEKSAKCRKSEENSEKIGQVLEYLS